ncbi:hypothetical protein CU098_006797, partial [Rhizopus stolonifer]
LENTLVKELKQYCQRITGISPNQMKLNAFGALMNNDELPISVYGLRPGCFVTLKSLPKPKAKPTSQPIEKNEQVLLDQIKATQTKIDTDLATEVKTYEKEVKAFMAQTDKEAKKKHVYKGAYLNEQLMHVLFDLDGLICGPDYTTARQARKEAVKHAQALLDKVDDIKSMLYR